MFFSHVIQKMSAISFQPQRWYHSLALRIMQFVKKCSDLFKNFHHGPNFEGYFILILWGVAVGNLGSQFPLGWLCEQENRLVSKWTGEANYRLRQLAWRNHMPVHQKVGFKCFSTNNIPLFKPTFFWVRSSWWTYIIAQIMQVTVKSLI